MEGVNSKEAESNDERILLCADILTDGLEVDKPAHEVDRREAVSTKANSGVKMCSKPPVTRQKDIEGFPKARKKEIQREIPNKHTVCTQVCNDKPNAGITSEATADEELSAVMDKKAMAERCTSEWIEPFGLWTVQCL